MEWTKGIAHRTGYKQFNIMIGDKKVINVTCRRNAVVSSSPWIITIEAWNISNYTFKWYERFHQKDVLAKVENVMQDMDRAKHAVFNRIFEGRM